MTVNRDRNLLPNPGATFFREKEGGEVLFRFVIDAGSTIGPRPATRADQERHPEAWAAFSQAHPLDRDGDGQPGGSLPADPEAELKAVLAEAEAFAAPQPDAKFVTQDGQAFDTAKEAVAHVAKRRPRKKG